MLERKHFMVPCPLTIRIIVLILNYIVKWDQSLIRWVSENKSGDGISSKKSGDGIARNNPKRICFSYEAAS